MHRHRKVMRVAVNHRPHAQKRGPQPDQRAPDFYVLQIPYLTTPMLSYHLGVGVMLYPAALQNGRNIQTQLGADRQGAFLGGDGLSLAINIVPVAALVMLRRPVSLRSLKTDPLIG
jgi:hypothetical protein